MYTTPSVMTPRMATRKGPSKTRRPEYEAALRRRIDAGGFIEAKDWMPEHYRKDAAAADQPARAPEIVGMLPEGNWISRAPSPSAKGPSCWPRCRTRAATACTCMPPPKRRVSRDEQMMKALHSGQGWHSSIFNTRR